MNISVDLRGDKRLKRAFDRFPDVLEREARIAMRSSLDVIEGQVSGRTPVNTGALRGSIGTDVRGTPLTELRGTVGTPLLYGEVVERGRRPGKMPPVAPIRFWVIRKGIAPAEESRSVAFLIARAIGRRDTEGAYMFRRGFQASLQSVLKFWYRLPEKVIRRARLKR